MNYLKIKEMKKITILHGWNWHSYASLPKNQQKNPWWDKVTFIEELKRIFKINILFFPGFVGNENEPKKPWSIVNYIDFINKNSQESDLMVGYSFGASVLLSWKVTTENKNIPIVLVSPALSRKYEKRVPEIILKLSKSLKKNLPGVVYFFRNLYLSYLIRNPYYIYGSRFLKESYLSIVKEDTSKLIEKIDPDQILIIFGKEDTATPPHHLDKILNKNPELKSRIIVIPGAGHNLLNSHPKEIISYLQKFFTDENNTKIRT